MNLSVKKWRKAISPERAAFLLALTAFLLAAWFGGNIPLDTSDGYDFLLEARAQSVEPWQINWERPRALVLILSAHDSVFQFMYGRLPDMADVHLLMSTIAALFLLVWFAALRNFFSSGVALASVALIALLPDFILNSFICMADLLAGLIFGFIALALSSKRLRTSGWGLALIGVLSALEALAKNQEFGFPAVMLALVIFCDKENRRVRSAVTFCLSYAVAVEALHRTMASPKTGLFSYLEYLVRKIFWAFDVPELTSKMVYVDRLIGSLGWPLLIVLTFGLLALAPYLILSSKHRTFVRSPRVFLGILATALVFIALNQKIPNREERYLLPFYAPLFAFSLGAYFHCLSGFSKAPRAVFSLLLLALFIHPAKQSARATAKLGETAKDQALRRELATFWSSLRGESDGLRCDRVLTSSDWGFDRAPGAYRLNAETRPRFSYQPHALGSPEVLKAALLKDHGTAPGHLTCFVLREQHWGEPNSLAVTVEKIVESESKPPTTVASQPLFLGRKRPS